MAQKQTKTEPAPLSDLFRLAEIIHMRRVALFNPYKAYYACSLCDGKSESEADEIQHKPTCPIMRLR